MATTYTLKRKLYSDDENENKHTGRKIAGAVGGAALAAGATFAGARRGMLGNRIAYNSNVLFAKAGRALDSKSMMKSAAHQMAKTNARMAKNAGITNEEVLKESISTGSKKFYKNILKKDKPMNYINKDAFNDLKTSYKDQATLINKASGKK